ncbi:FK506-binding protein 5-like isoform X2 [Macrobrachium rosenbergii]|uniref:FK506-binding protein 5-like isoform X2 n=1 Tax=Macrobrachium rosenbergii TaxID=79674 RepID=UPI0034D750BD
MGRAICLCLLASLAVGLAVPVTDPPSPSDERELLNIILNAKSEDNDIDSLPVRNEVTTESKDNVTLDLAATTEAAVIEEETQQSSEIVPGTIVRDSTTTEEVVDPATATKVNQTELPKAPTALEPEDENVPLDSEDDHQYPPEKLSPEEQITGEEGIFEGDTDVMSVSDGLLNGNDQIIIIPDEGQGTFEDDSLEVPEEENTPVYGDQIVPEINEQMTSEEEPEVILVLDEKLQLMPATLEEGQFEGEEEDEQRIQVPIDQAQSGEEQIFIIEEGEAFPTTEEKEESFIPFEDSLTEEEQFPVEDSFMEKDRMPAQDPFMAEEQIPGKNPFMTDEQMPPFSMIMPISEEQYIPNANEDSIFGSDSFLFLSN